MPIRPEPQPRLSLLARALIMLLLALVVGLAFSLAVVWLITPEAGTLP